MKKLIVVMIILTVYAPAELTRTIVRLNLNYIPEYFPSAYPGLWSRSIAEIAIIWTAYLMGMILFCMVLRRNKWVI